MHKCNNMAHRLSQTIFMKIFLIPNYRGLSVFKSFFYFFGLFSKTRIFLIFCMVVEDYRWLSVQKGVFFYFFVFCKTTLRIFLIFCMSVDRAYCLSQIICLNKFLIPNDRGLSVQQRWFFLLVKNVFFVIKLWEW